MMEIAVTAESLSEIIETSAAEVLETMFFSSIEGIAESMVADGEGQIAARLRFRGTPSGALSLVISRQSANTLFASFAGIDEISITEQQREEILSEMTNVVCGSILSRVESDAVFDLGSPFKLNPEAALQPVAEGSLVVQRSFDTDDGVLTVVFELEVTE
ncbi:MAG: chemotaxis protein CheX [Bryobacteraceae bacterium]|nr:chemotaxis protein CheX [Bryobacteraceae bacterium]